MEIIGNVKNYDWGKLGEQSEVAKLASINSNDFTIDASTPYAELWMGTHPSGPSLLKSNGDELGKKCKKLSFLFKVLSIRKALSIQVHPNKLEAERLNKESPDVYKDDNHKPELAIALTPFLALCGFRPHEEIYQFIEKLPPLKKLIVANDGTQTFHGLTTESLRECYSKLMNSSDGETKQCIEDITNNYSKVLKDHKLDDVFQTINADFPNDVGVLSLFFLNLLRLQPGQAIFLGANEIHAYLYGDCIECMACSDNVIRAGLTPKYKDVNQLISCLNYKGLPASNKIFQPHRIDEFLRIFVPPVEDFAVAQLSLPAGKDYSLLLKEQRGSVMLVLQGQRTLRLNIREPKDECIDIALKRGSIVYIPPEAAPEIQFLTSADDSVPNEAFTAYTAMHNFYKN